MKTKKLGKKADSKMLSLWWIFVLAFAGGIIVIGVLIFYSYEADVRNAEASILSEKIISCLADEGRLNLEFLSDDFDIYSSCALNKKAIDSGFFIKIELRDEEGNVLKTISEGKQSFDADCNISGNENIRQADYFPRCSEETINVLQGVLYVKAGSNQQGVKGI